ncbi:MAG: TldD/PmbA family protein [Candidatus Hydrogenedentes bacterium]|nr:TldD/PmbA family protein [Candidatus Hydrogenedentota bacterium]
MDRTPIEQALDTALHVGAAEAEIVFERTVNLDIEVAQREVETLLRAEAIGAGVRVFTPDKRMGFAYTSVLDGGLEKSVAAACENARLNEPDEFNGLPDETTVSEDDWTEEDFTAIPIARKVDACRALEKRVIEADTRITHVQHVSYSDGHSEWSVASSHGLFRTYRVAHATCSVVAAAAQPGCDAEMGWEFDFAYRFDALRWDWVADRCAEHATRGLGGKPCTGGRMPVVLDPYVAGEFLGVVGSSFMTNNVLKGKSLFANRVGDTVASPLVTVVDQNDLPGEFNRAPFDAEGVSAARKAVIDGGVLRGYLHNAYTARKMGVGPTANATRGGGFRSTPEVGASNAYLVPGDMPREALLDFVLSFGVAGLAIEHGRLAGPVRGVTLAGNIKDLLADIVAIGNDLRFYGEYGAPSVLVASLMIAGE